MKTVYAIYSKDNQAWITRQRDFEFDLNVSCLFDTAPRHLAGTIYKFVLAIDGEWENEPKSELPELEIE